MAKTGTVRLNHRDGAGNMKDRTKFGVAETASVMLGVTWPTDEERPVAEVPVPFAGVLRGLRTEAGMTLEELAEAAGLSSRAISYLERGEVSTPRKDTVQLLADALRLTGPARAQFETAARGRRSALPAAIAAATRALPRDVDSFTGRQRELAELVRAGADGVVSVHAIGGMAGVGKTAFAVHAAHRHASRFPGGEARRGVWPLAARLSRLRSSAAPAVRGGTYRHAPPRCSSGCCQVARGQPGALR